MALARPRVLASGAPWEPLPAANPSPISDFFPTRQPGAPSGEGAIHVPYSPVFARLHAGGAAGSDRHHWHPDRPAFTGRAGGPRIGPPHRLHQQDEADRPGAAQLSPGQPTAAAADVLFRTA